MESPSLQFNGANWSVFRLGEKTWLLQPEADSGVLSFIHKTVSLIESSSISSLIDIVPAYDSLMLVFSEENIDLSKELEALNEDITGTSAQTHIIEVCYDLGLDWKEAEEYIGLSKQEIVETHSSEEYTIAMMGFLPGFIFLEGLDNRLFIPRKENPRTEVPAGSIGIGGSQTGIYSLESPGGWQIIGQTPQSFFNADVNPPSKLRAGDKVLFKPISKEEFSELGKTHG